MSDAVILREMEMMEWWTGKSGNEHIEFWLKNKHLEEICWWGYLIYRTKIPQCYTFWKDKWWFHACSSTKSSWHMVSSSNWPLQSPGKATAVISSRVTMAALPPSPRNGLCHRCALKFESHNCCTPPCFQSDFQRTSVGMKKLAVLYCWAYFPVLLAFRLFLRSLQPILAAAQAFGLDLIQRILLKLVWTFRELKNFHGKFSHLVLLSRLQVWGLNFHHRKSVHGTGRSQVSGLHMILREVPQLIWTMAQEQNVLQLNPTLLIWNQTHRYLLLWMRQHTTSKSWT